jgi:hypothetical protein
VFPIQARWLAAATGAVVVIAAIAGGAWFFGQHRVVSVASSARECVSPPASVASLFFDDQYTQIRVSSPDLSNLRVLRSEPANVMPGMFESLLAMSPDASRLSYVTAQDEMMDGAHLYYLDISSPDQRHTLADVASGLSPVRPAWSPDGQELAYVTGSDASGAAKFQVWVARAGSGQPEMRAELPPDTFAQGHTAALCWSRTGAIGVLPGIDSASRQVGPTSTPVTGQSTPTPTPINGGTAHCAVPVLSQNDPAWQAAIMLAGGDPIGGFGCALTSTAMLLDYFGANITPPQLSACLGGLADPVDWASAPSCTKGLVSGGARFDFSWPQLDSILGSGRPAIVGMMRGQTGMHWVVVTSGGGDYAQNYKIVDPWDGTTTKTLGSYSNAGYQLRWIISMDGQGQGCGRLLKGGAPVKGFTDGSSGSGSVTVTKSNPGDSVTVIKQGANPPTQGASPSPSPTGSGVFKVDKSALFAEEGVYLVIVIHKGDPTPIVMKFTIDKTPPALGVTLVNPIQGPAISTQIFNPLASASASLPHMAQLLSAKIYAAEVVPTLARPGKVTIEALDTLSGMNTVQYSLDGAPMVPYSDETNNHRQLTVDQPGPHTLTVKAVDLAGNPTPAGTRAFIVEPPVVAPTPTPTATPTQRPTAPPTPRPTPCPPTITGLTATLPPGTNVVTVSWMESMPCGFASANLTGTADWGPASGKKPVSWLIPLRQPQGPYSEDPRTPLGGCQAGQFTLAYTLTLTDARAVATTAQSNAILYTPCG